MWRKNLFLKNKFYISIIIFLLSFCISGKFAFATINLFDDTITIFGRLELLAGVRTEDGGTGRQGDASNFRWTLQPEIKWKMYECGNTAMSLYFIPRFFWEGAADISNHWSSPTWRKDQEFPREDEWLRELYLDYKQGPFSLRIGKQQVVWGESDGIRIADIINPLDLGWHYQAEAWRDIRRPLWMIDAIYTIPRLLCFQNVDLEPIWIPIYFQNTRLASAEANWAIPGLSQPILNFYNDSQPLEHLSLNNSAEGGRIRGLAGPVEWSVFTVHKRADGGVFSLNNYLDYLFDGGSREKVFLYPWTQDMGATFNFFNEWTKTVFRGECVFIHNDPFNNASLTEIDKKDTFAYMLGFDKNIYMRWLNPVNSFFISGQFYQKWILNFDRDEQVQTTTQDRREHQTILSLFVSTDYHDVVLPKVLAVIDLGGNGNINPEVTFKIGMEYRIAVGANFYYGQWNRETYFDPIHRNDECYVRLQYWF